MKKQLKYYIFFVYFMRNDEFNKVEITNEKQISGLEFGKTQRAETVSQKENK